MTEPRNAVAPSPSDLPRWRGFNLTEMCSAQRQEAFRESDFAWMAEWGFDFARLPLSYRCWADSAAWRELREDALAQIDAAVELGRQYGVHVDLNFHRAPGFCVLTSEDEPFDLWTDDEALEACAFYGAHFAARYRGVPNERLSFNLVNEPIEPDPADHLRVVTRLVEAIREADPDRLIIADGTRWGRVPTDQFIGLGIAQSAHAYDPIHVCFCRMGNVRNSDTWPVPTWPVHIRDDDPQWRGRWDRDRLRAVCIEPWKGLQRRGVGVHVGETGCYCRTPHDVALDWMGDLLRLWREAGWGWALWNLRGPLGVVDSGRDDVQYEGLGGHRLDRHMLELLRADGEAGP